MWCTKSTTFFCYMDEEMNKFAIIVAGGTGSRLGSDLPKQYMLLDKQPVLMYSIRAFYESDPHTHIIVVIAEQMLEYWQALCREHALKVEHQLVFGGQTRTESVRNALDFITATYADRYRDSLIAVHDGARPLIQAADINHLYKKAKEYNCVVPAVQSTDSIRVGSSDKNYVMNREVVWKIQTPQVFRGQILVSAYQLASQAEPPATFTDDASIVEEMGNTVHLVTGDYRNFKITYPEDISIAQIYLDALRKA